MGRSGPRPPPLVDPDRALNTLLAGDDPPVADTAETDERGTFAPVRDMDPAPAMWVSGFELPGAVASARAAAAAPVGPSLARARTVEAAIPPPPPELEVPPAPPELAVPPGPPEPRDEPVAPLRG
jgi:hypothetical protein